MSTRKEDLAAKVEAIRNILVTRATGGTYASGEYERLRRELLRDPDLKDRLPRVLQTCFTPDDFWGFIKPKFGSYQERRDFLKAEFTPVLNYLEGRGDSPSDLPITQSLKSLSPADIHGAWTKALERREADPEGAITAARTLLEITCKFILDQQGRTFDQAADLPKLYQSTAKSLNLAPDQHQEEVFKKILGGCKSVVEGLGALRNSLGDAHGRSPGSARPAGRHAALAVNLAGATATFLIETFETKSKK